MLSSHQAMIGTMPIATKVFFAICDSCGDYGPEGLTPAEAHDEAIEEGWESRRPIENMTIYTCPNCCGGCQ